MKRYLAHHVIFRGVEHRMAILEISETASGFDGIKIMPFTGEIHSTSFHSGTIIVHETEGGPKLEFLPS